MNATKTKLLRLVFSFALIAGCLGLAACAGSGSTDGDQAASSAAAEADDATQEASSAEAASAEGEADDATEAAEATETEPAVGGISNEVNVADVEKVNNPDAVAGTETMPALMPASHESYLAQAELPCQTCHGVDESGTPKNAEAAELPKGHYVDEDPSTGQIDPARAQCISCHVVDPSK